MNIKNNKKINKYGLMIDPKKLNINTIGIIPKKVTAAKVTRGDEGMGDTKMAIIINKI